MLDKIAEEADVVDDKRQAAEQKPERRVWRVLPPDEHRAWAPSWVVGSLVHRAIELERFPDDPRFEGWFRASARELGVSTEAMLANALRRARIRLNKLEASDIWRQIIRSERRIHEIPYSYESSPGRVERGVIDIAWRHAGRWRLIDFKTDYVEYREAMQARIEEKRYDQQVRRYIRAMQKFLGETPRAWLCFLDVAGEVVIVEVKDED